MVQRFQRLWKLALFAKDMVAARLGAKRAKQRAADRVGRMHGLPQKFGQILALFELDNPSTWSTTTESRAALPAECVFPLIEKSLDCKIADCFRAIETVAIAASIGQVHRAMLHDGRAAAVKVQYPDCAGNVETDLTAMGWLSAPLAINGQRFNATAYQREIGSMMRQELDYAEEARNLKQFSHLGADCPWLVMPQVIDELSSDGVLTMTWLEGDRFDAVRHWPEDDRRQAARLLVRLFLTSYFEWGLLHADPHPGNYRFLRTNGAVQIGLLDFGCVRRVDESQRRAIAQLIDLARRPPGPTDEAAALELYSAVGFNSETLAPMAHRLPKLNRILFEPFTQCGLRNAECGMKNGFDVSSWRLSERVGQALQEDRWNFRVAGPADLILVIRSYLGLTRYLHALNVPVDWSETYDEIQGRLPQKQGGAMFEEANQKELTLPRQSAAGDEATITGKIVRSRHLRVRVSEAGCTRVDLTFKATAAEILADLVPTDLEDRLKERGLDVNQIAAEAVAREFSPGELFHLTDGVKQVRVWLE